MIVNFEIPHREMHHTKLDLCLGSSPDGSLELFRERFVIEEQPGVVEFTIPCPFQISDRLEHILELIVPDKGEEGCINAL